MIALAGSCAAVTTPVRRLAGQGSGDVGHSSAVWWVQSAFLLLDPWTRDRGVVVEHSISVGARFRAIVILPLMLPE